MYRACSLFVLALLLVTGACTDDAPTRLSTAQMEVLDSLISERMPLVRQEEDSICAAGFERKLRILVDSILIARREEEARLRQMIPRQ